MIVAKKNIWEKYVVLQCVINNNAALISVNTLCPWCINKGIDSIRGNVQLVGVAKRKFLTVQHRNRT